MTDIFMEEVETFWVRVYIAGDIFQVMQVCREECMRQGLCVTVESTSYIYTGGEESGVVVGLINYPRFPNERAEIIERAIQLGKRLMEKLCQRSFSLMTPERTTRYFRQIDGAGS